MSISATCPECGRGYTFGDDKAGKRFRCKACETIVQVPEAEVVAAATEDDWDFGNDQDEEEDENPYAAPAAKPKRRKRRKSSGSLVTTLPGAFLMVMSVLGLFLILIVGSIQVLEQTRGRDLNTPEGMGALIGGASVVLVNAVSCVIVMLGGYNLAQRKSYGMALTGAILACTPCLSPCIFWGIPFGIWALVVLLIADVKPHFR